MVEHYVEESGQCDDGNCDGVEVHPEGWTVLYCVAAIVGKLKEENGVAKVYE